MPKFRGLMDSRDVVEAIRDLEAQGHFLSAHDRVMSAIEAGAASDDLRHLAVLTLARGGATASALALLHRFGLATSSDPEIAGLYPRLLKDMALASADAAAATAACRAYTVLWEREPNGWYGINAAAMSLLAGNRDHARQLATSVCKLSDDGSYWSAATQAEAALLTGDPLQADRWLEKAEARAGHDLAARATTRRQLRWEAALLGLDTGLVDRLVIPETLHYSGRIPGGKADEASLRAELASKIPAVGFAFGGMAAGADLVIVEALLERGAEVTAVLPFPVEAYVDRSVRIGGEEWVQRFNACLPRVQLEVLEDGPQDDLDYALAGRRAMGLAKLHANRLEGSAWQLAIWDSAQSPSGPAGTAADVAGWKASGGAVQELESPWPRRKASTPMARPQRQAKAVLFGDLTRFSTLDDAALLNFYEGPLRAMGKVIDSFRPDYRNSWGDAVQMVFGDPAAAALCAFDLNRVGKFDVDVGMTHSELIPRLALDFGGVHSVFDHVQGASKFSGRVMTRAARIEPVTPPGVVYATEAFACEIALMNGSAIACDYTGRVPLAKNFGTLPLYMVRRRTHFAVPR